LDVLINTIVSIIIVDGDIPPRPPLPHETAPARPPPPDTDDEEDFPIPQANQPIMVSKVYYNNVSKICHHFTVYW
jgi:hypothetical protein